jgi:pyruvate dehydrogenase E2 component (dihydrolipoamide acetyltransferase)
MTQVIQVPDIGNYQDVLVIEVLVQEGQEVILEQPLITIETDKAAMEIPATMAGKIARLHVQKGSKVSKGSLIVELATAAELQPSSGAAAPAAGAMTKGAVPAVHIPASPETRKLARQYDIDLQAVAGSGKHGRITKEDLQAHLQPAAASPALTSAAAPAAVITATAAQALTGTQTLPKIKQLSGKNLQRNWQNIPHVTHFDEADITDLEAFRSNYNSKLDAKATKLTAISFIIKAIAQALQAYPHFNATLSSDCSSIIFNTAINIGVAVDTPQGLLVPVIKAADTKGLAAIASELQFLSQKARENKLLLGEMQQGSFTISSLGSVGGVGFTPIINAPELAILGVAKAKVQPVYHGQNLVPRLLLPLCLSYDHRAIDGVQAAKFTSFLVRQLSDIRNLLL